MSEGEREEGLRYQGFSWSGILNLILRRKPLENFQCKSDQTKILKGFFQQLCGE